MRRNVLVIEKIDGRPARESPHFARFRDQGFADDYRGLVAEFY
jgi:hypothetical protein